MYKIATINTPIEPELKHKAEAILHKVGLTSAEAVRLFYKQICLRKGLPFEVKIPNPKTLKAMRDAEEGKTHKVKHIDELFKDLE
ncbi:MAG TPA: type II toxin-antitoxin system RelB/DinJ family antitoxin [Gammaproteobacteria bacterium]|nr:type II toxin-antitoxin system RelB/DinJ family antitoxin [Gammaproteobacteria bacterium]